MASEPGCGHRSGLRLGTATLAALLGVPLAACGTQPTGHGAPPYDEHTQTAKVGGHLKKDYPGLALRFSLPALATYDVGPVRAYIAFTVAATRSVRDAELDPAVRTNSTAALSKFVRSQVSQETDLGYRSIGPTRADIRQVVTSTNASLKVCIHDQNRFRTSSGAVRSKAATTRSNVVFLARRKSGRWYVASIGTPKSPLRHC